MLLWHVASIGLRCDMVFVQNTLVWYYCVRHCGVLCYCVKTYGVRLLCVAQCCSAVPVGMCGAMLCCDVL